MNQQNSPQLSATAWLMLLLLALLWGGSFFFARVAVQHVPPFTLALLRFVIAALCLHAFIAARFNIYAEIRARWRSFLLLGLINNVIPHACIFLGQTEIGAGLAAILNATTPIWTVIIAHFATADEKLTGVKIAGTLIGLAGTVLLFSPHIAAKTDAPLWALVLPVIAAVSYGFAVIFARRFRDIAAPVTAAGQLTASTVIMLPVAMIVDRPWTLAWPPFDAAIAVLALAVVSTAFAYILYFRLISTAGATNASLVTLLVPPSAILLGILFLGEHLGWAEWTGMLVIGVGLVILDGRLVARLAERAS
jgi:drug/metabolite transporter (DMT)-like permease